jgi:hypothetical protein
MFKIFLFSLLLFSNLLFSADFTYVNSEEEFFMHMRNHVNNVQSLANVLLDKIEKNPKKYAELFGMPDDFKMDDKFRKLVTDFMSLHDIAKINTSKEFLALNNSPLKPLISELYKLYGVTFNETNAEQFKIINGIINKADKAAGEKFLEQNIGAENKWVKEFLLEFESFVDKSERANNPVVTEEMGRPVSQTSEYLRSQKARLQKMRIETPDLYLKAHQKELADYPDSKINLIEKFEKEFTELYPKVTTPYLFYKKKVNKFKKVLKNAKIETNYLDQYSLYQMMTDFEKAKGKAILATNDLNAI